MTGPVQLKSQKGLLTRYRNILNQLISKYSEAFENEVSPRLLSEMSYELNATSKLVIEALENFTRTVDQVEELQSGDQETQIQDYIDKTHTVLENAQTLTIQIERKKVGLQQPTVAQTSAVPELSSAKVELPAIPIPMFSGKISEFENFWALFSANVHNQKLSNLQKFNYLLRALRSDAREVIKRYPVTEDNYNAAVDALHSKFGDKSKIIHDLQGRLERVTARSPFINDQRKLLENLLAITTQLEQKGVYLNGSYSVQKVLSKFRQDLQRRILKDQIESDYSEQEWSMSKLLSDLDRLINAEEKINEMLHASEAFRGRDRTSVGQKRFDNAPTRPTACIYCDATNHNSLRCAKVSSIQARTDFLIRYRKCLNCAKTNHFLKNCLSKGCSMCDDKKHHFSICPKRIGKESATAQQKREGPAGTPPIVKRVRQDKGRNTHRQNCAVTSDTHALPEADDRETSSLCVSNTELTSKQNNVLLLTGLAKARNEKSGELLDIEILLDTGADRSFIQRQLADDLELPVVSKVDLSVYTFGDKTPKKQEYDVTSLQIWDALGDSHDLHLCKTDVITEKAKQVHLTSEDVEYLQEENIALSKKKRTPINPQILLGCDQLWPLLSTTNPQHILPSGLMVIPSKLGYLLSGRQEQGSDNLRKGENFHIARIGTLAVEEVDEWDRYWSRDSSGIEEYSGTKYEEKAQVNAKIMQFFNDTIEKRHDGYYVLSKKTATPYLQTRR